MAQTGRNVPPTFPQPLGNQIQKADTQRQVSMLRQEIVSDLLSVLGEARESGVRLRLIRLVEANLKRGLAATSKAEELWPDMQKVRAVLDGQTESKPALARKHLKVFEQADKVHRRSLDLLHSSFENIQVILDRLQPVEPPSAQPGSGQNTPSPHQRS
jgi:hypothetical protein